MQFSKMFIKIVTIDVAAAASSGNSRYGYNAAAAMFSFVGDVEL